MDFEVVDVGDGEPGGGVGLVVVRAGLSGGGGGGGTGVEAQCELLVDGVVGVGMWVGSL